MSFIIDQFKSEDEAAWRRLWDDNNRGHRNEAVTAQTWARILSPDAPVNGLAARVDGALAGLVHYILHPVTGHLKPACYMQDLYIDPAFRQRGIGRKLVEHLAQIGKAEGWARLYWLAEANNEAAQALYKNVGFRLDFTLHVMPLG